MGAGTKGLSVAEHGPHVGMAKFPDAAFVELKVFIPSLNKSATIMRKLSAPSKPKITPSDPAVKAALEEIADHPEIALSRREILRFILVEPTKRSEEIQTILKLEEIGQTRAALNTAQNRLLTAFKAAEGQVRASRDALLRHLQLAALRTTELLEAVNARRKTLGVAELKALNADTKLDAGLGDADKAPTFNKQSLLRDLKAIADAIVRLGSMGKPAVDGIVAALRTLEEDRSLLEALQRKVLIEKGLELIDGPDCPLCDKPWEDEDHLRAHLQSKLAKSAAATKLQAGLQKAGDELAREVSALAALVDTTAKIALTQWLTLPPRSWPRTGRLTSHSFGRNSRHSMD